MNANIRVGRCFYDRALVKEFRQGFQFEYPKEDNQFDDKSTNSKGYFTLKNSSKKSDIIRKCGRCGVTLPQKEMIRDDCSDTGWICPECDSDLHPDFESNEF